MTLADRLVVMHEGKIQQNATAQECYERPANRFVAGFIGTPPMNLVDGQMESGVFTANSVSMPIAAGPFRRDCTLGVRPDRLRIVSSEQPGALSATIATIERLGDRTDLALDTAWGRLTARVDAALAHHFREGTRVGVTVDAKDTHYFERGACGVRIDGS